MMSKESAFVIHKQNRTDQQTEADLHHTVEVFIKKRLPLITENIPKKGVLAAHILVCVSLTKCCQPVVFGLEKKVENTNVH